MIGSSGVVVIPFLLAALLAFGLAAAAWRRARTPGSLIFTLAMVAVMFWLLCAAGEIGASLVETKILWAKFAYFSIAWIGVLWLLFTLEYLHPGQGYARRLAAPLGVIPALTIGLVLTNEAHGLIWTEIIPTPPTAGWQASGPLIYNHGPAFWAFAVYSYTLLCMGSWNLVRGAFGFRRAQKYQLLGLLAGMAFPWAGNILYLSGIRPLGETDLTPFGFALTGLIYAWVLYRRRLFEFVPLAYEAIVENISDGYLVLNERDQVVELNAAGCRMLQLKRESCLGRPVESVLSEWPDLLALARAEPPAQGEIGAPGGRPLWLYVSTCSWRERDGRAAGRLLILHDVTRRKQAEESLRASEQLYRLVVNAAPVGISLVDQDGKITFSSPYNQWLYQVEGDGAIRDASPLEFIHPDDRELAAARIRQVLENQDTLQPQEYRLLRSDGSYFWGEITSAPIAGLNGRSQGMVVMTRDITQRKTLEMDLQRTLERVTLIKDLLQILYRARDISAALESVLERTGRFVGASRVYLCHDSPDGSETTITKEWCRPGITPRSTNAALVRYAAIPSWQRQMETLGSVVVTAIGEAVPEDLAEFLDAWGTCSLAAYPIYGSEERLYGFLAVDHCDAPRDWTEDDLDLMRTVSRIVSGAVAQMQTETAGRRQRALAEALHDTAAALNSTLNFEEVLDRILSNLERVVPNASASIALVDSDNTVQFVRWRGYDAEGEEMMRTLRLRVDERETYHTMARTGQPIIIGDTWLDKRWTMYPAYAWIRSYAGAPIQTRGKLVGFLNLDSAEPEFFSQELSYSLGVFADQAAVAIENAHLYDSARRSAEEMSTLNRVAATLTAGLEIDQVLLALFDECRRALPIDVFSVALYDAEAGMIEMPLYYNAGAFQDITPRNIHEEPGLTGEVIRLRRTLYLPDTLDPETAGQHSIIRLGGRPARSYVGVPLMLLAQVVGVISMQSFEPHAYTPEQVRLLEMIATHAAIAVQNARLYDQMKRMAITDAVTGLFSRRHFTDCGRTEVERARRYRRQLSVLMVDIDRFKRVNDTYGHNAGDQVLQAAAQNCRQALRVTDIVGRWGGEEFAILLPEADRDGAGLIAERIRRIMSESDIVLPDGPIRVTVSIGVATLSDECNTLESLIDQADRAMYMAKDAGRNKVRFAA